MSNNHTNHKEHTMDPKESTIEELRIAIDGMPYGELRMTLNNMLAAAVRKAKAAE
jgi:hypothetical protein